MCSKQTACLRRVKFAHPCIGSRMPAEWDQQQQQSTSTPACVGSGWMMSKLKSVKPSRLRSSCASPCGRQQLHSLAPLSVMSADVCLPDGGLSRDACKIVSIVSMAVSEGLVTKYMK